MFQILKYLWLSFEYPCKFIWKWLKKKVAGWIDSVVSLFEFYQDCPGALCPETGPSLFFFLCSFAISYYKLVSDFCLLLSMSLSVFICSYLPCPWSKKWIHFLICPDYFLFMSPLLAQISWAATPLMCSYMLLSLACSFLSLSAHSSRWNTALAQFNSLPFSKPESPFPLALFYLANENIVSPNVFCQLPAHFN